MQQSLVNSSFKYCEKIAKEHYENFPVASLLLPKKKRKYVFAIYAFARIADDFADEPGIEGGNEKRLALLNEWHGKLKDCYSGKAYDPVFIALGETVKDNNIPVETLESLLKAFKQDVVKQRYKNFNEILEYCSNSAIPVGRLVLMIFGCFNKKFFEYSDKICTALQLTNFWQDVSVDLKKNRVYLPEDDIEKFEYSYNELFDKVCNRNFKKMMEFQLTRTQRLFDEGYKLIEMTHGEPGLKKLSKELKLIWLGGTTILKGLKDIDYDVFNHRPVISKFGKIKLFIKSR